VILLRNRDAPTAVIAEKLTTDPDRTGILL
jgi:hypothetical protein